MKQLKSLVKSFGCALHGIWIAYPGQRNIKIQTFFGVVAILMGLYFPVSKAEFLIVICLSFLVPALEILNTAIEEVVNEISLERKESLGRIKDMAAGAVLVLAILSAVIGTLIFSPHLIKLFS